jgi:endonuclease YncB( thermonuclease family)
MRDNPDFSSFRGQIRELVISPFPRQVGERRHLAIQETNRRRTISCHLGGKHKIRYRVLYVQTQDSKQLEFYEISIRDNIQLERPEAPLTTSAKHFLRVKIVKQWLRLDSTEYICG